jgi:Glycosyl hydrolases family 25
VLAQNRRLSKQLRLQSGLSWAATTADGTIGFGCQGRSKSGRLAPVEKFSTGVGGPVFSRRRHIEAPRAGWTTPAGQPLNACYNMTAARLVGWTRAFLAEVTARTGRLGVIYTSTSWWNRCTRSNVTFSANPLWIARYATSPLPLPAGWANLAFWQYSSGGELPTGALLDQDVFRGNAAALATLAQGTTNVTFLARANARYVTAESAGRKPLIANRTAAGPWERFQLLTNRDGSNSLRALINGKYVTADHAGANPLIANRTRIGPWERFKLILNSDVSFSLRALINGKYVTADHAGASPLIANRTRIGPWERFKLVTIQIPARRSAQKLISAPYSGQR